MTIRGTGHWARRAFGEFMLDVIPVSSKRATSDDCFCYDITVNIEEIIGDTPTGYVDDFGVLVMSPSWPGREWDRFRSYIIRGGDRELPPLVARPAVWFQETWDLEAVLERIDHICRVASPAPDYDAMFERLSRSLDCFLGPVADARVNRAAGLPAPGSPPPWAGESLKSPTSEPDP